MDKQKAIAAVQEFLSNMKAVSTLLAQQRATLESLIKTGENNSAAFHRESLSRAVERLRF